MDASLAEVIRFFNVKEAEFISKCQALQLELYTLERIPANAGGQSGAATPSGAQTPTGGSPGQSLLGAVGARIQRVSGSGAARLLGDITPSPSMLNLADMSQSKVNLDWS